MESVRFASNVETYSLLSVTFRGTRGCGRRTHTSLKALYSMNTLGRISQFFLFTFKLHESRFEGLTRTCVTGPIVVFSS